MLHVLRQPSRAAPLRTLLFCHGLGDSERGWTFLQAVLGLEWLEVILVRAPMPREKGFAWYGLGDRETRERDLETSRVLLEGLVESLGVPPGRLFLGGFSQGAVLALEATLRAVDPFAGCLAVSGHAPLWRAYPQAFGAGLPAQRILATHGAWDPVIPRDVARRQLGALRDLGAPVTFEVFDKAHELEPEEELPRLRAFLAEGCAGA